MCICFLTNRITNTHAERGLLGWAGFQPLTCNRMFQPHLKYITTIRASNGPRSLVASASQLLDARSHINACSEIFNKLFKEWRALKRTERGIYGFLCGECVCECVCECLFFIIRSGSALAMTRE